MADPKKPTPAGKKVAVLDPSGAFGFIDEADVPNLPSSARVLTQKQLVQRQVDEAYDKQSTAQKVVGTLAGPTASQLANPTATAITGKAPDVAIAAHPAVESFSQGALEPLTLGTERIAMKQATKALAGEQAAKDYVQHGEDVATAYSGANTAGQVAGFATGAMIGGASGLGISALGGGAEALAAKGVGSVVGKGVLGRALTSAAGLGARGAVEGGLYAGAHEAVEENLQDHELAADKIWAATGTGMIYGGVGGAALGGAGSLAKSAVKGSAGALGRVMAKGENAALRAEEAAVEGGAGASAAQNPVGQPRGFLERQSNELAFSALGATKAQAKSALEHVAGKSEAVGEYVNRAVITPAGKSGGLVGGSLRAGLEGRADQILVKVTEDKYGRIASGLSDSIKSTPARFAGDDVVALAEGVHAAMLTDPTKIAGADAFINRVKLELSAVKNAGKIATDGTMDAADAFYTRASMERGAYELGGTSNAAKEAYKEFLRKWDSSIVDTIDKAATDAGKSGAKKEILHWKREWQLASAAQELAEHGADRVKLNNILNLRTGVGVAVGFATGNPLAALATGIGGKLVSERGAAAGAYALSRAAHMQSLSALVAKTNGLIDRASTGLLQAPKPGALPASIATPSTKPQAAALAAMKMVAQYQSDPEKMADNVTRNTESMASHSPEIATAVAQRAVAAHAFLSEKMPPGADPDPLDPHPAPHMTNSEAATFARYAWYAEKPDRFFLEAAHGKLTPEGAETAQRLMPSAFAELQTRTADALATQLAKGTTIPFQQRLLLGQLLNFAAVPSQRPDHMQMLQKNVTVDPPQPAPAPKPLKTGSISTQRSSYDRLEASGPGRR